MERFHFPAWINTLLPVLGLVAGGGAAYLGAVGFAATHPATTDVGYRPEQPIPFSHTIHAGKLQMDCRYCHNTVEKASHAAIPPVATCLNCHAGKVEDKDGNMSMPATVSVHYDSARLDALRTAVAENKSVPWRRVHDLPDYVYFNHSVHVNRGVSCVSCHGRIDTLDVVEQKKTLAMGFCLKCHRGPEASIRPLDEVTNLSWEPPEGTTAEEIGKKIVSDMGIHPNENCSTCHR